MILFTRTSVFVGGFLWIAAGLAHAQSGASTTPETITIPAGVYWTGSSLEERNMAYQLDEDAYGHTRTRDRQWYANERTPREIWLPTYQITRDLITNEAYATFIRATGHQSPDVSLSVWQGYGLVHSFERTRRHAWTNSGDYPHYPRGRAEHPVVLVTLGDAMSYAHWLSSETDQHWRLPTEEEWEKAARGVDGRWFPWGNTFNPDYLNSHDSGPFDTVPISSHPNGESPFGLRDAAGQVFEWTSSTYTADRYVVKGGSWDDKGCGICRPAARHTRPGELKHILIGFRLILENP